MIQLISPYDNELISLLPDTHREVRNGGKIQCDAQNEIDWRNLKSDGKERSYPIPVNFIWNCDVKQASILEISEDYSFLCPLRYYTREQEYSVWNLKIGVKYYWRVISQSKIIDISEIRFFQTEDISPRLIHIDGLTNVRDIGGWYTQDGKKINQGLAYRGSEMNIHHQITKDGIDEFLGKLGIRTDLDLRLPEETKGIMPLGDRCRYIQVTVNPYEQFFFPQNINVCREIIDILSDYNNYPIYMHCWGGADRTGTVALILQSILGMCDEDIMQDYEFTSFSVWGSRLRNSQKFENLMNALSQFGDKNESISSKVMKYFDEYKISKSKLEKIKKIFLERRE